jgi:hypothetical protein
MQHFVHRPLQQLLLRQTPLLPRQVIIQDPTTSTSITTSTAAAAAQIAAIDSATQLLQLAPADLAVQGVTDELESSNKVAAAGGAPDIVMFTSFWKLMANSPLQLAQQLLHVIFLYCSCSCLLSFRFVTSWHRQLHHTSSSGMKLFNPVSIRGLETAAAAAAMSSAGSSSGGGGFRVVGITCKKLLLLLLMRMVGKCNLLLLLGLFAQQTQLLFQVLLQVLDLLHNPALLLHVLQHPVGNAGHQRQMRMQRL